MADKNNGGLTGAYYRPPGPPRCTSHGVIPDSDLRCSSCLSSFFKLLFCVILMVATIALPFWLIARPNRLVVYAENASLFRFELTPDGRSLAYNLSLGLSVRNPNRVAFYFDRLDAAAFFDGYRFSYDYSIKPFFQDQMNTTLLHAGFSGQQALAVATVAETFRKDVVDGWFDFQVKLYTKVSMKVWFIKINKYSPGVTCDLRLPAPYATGAGGFSRTQCSVDYF